MSTPWSAPGSDPESIQAPSAASLRPTVPGPRWGEMAPPGYLPPVAQSQAPQQGSPPQYYAQVPVTRKRHHADVVVTMCLLFIGLCSTLFACAIAAVLEPALQKYWAQNGLTFHGSAAVPGEQLFIVLSQVVLLAIAVTVSIILMVHRRIAFWVPLVAGAVAAVLFWGALIFIIASDPSLINAINAANGN